MNDPWTLLARNIATGKVVVLDKEAWEGTPSNSPPPVTDGRVVVWQTFQRSASGDTSILRLYDLDTGQRRVLAKGGNPNARTSWAYYGVRVSGQWVVTQKEWFSHGREQIILINLNSGKAHSVTPANAANSDPSISGNIVTWILGYRTGGAHGIAVYQIVSGTKVELHGSWMGLPEATAGRYVVYGHAKQTQLNAYNAISKANSVVQAANDGGYHNGTTVKVGSQTVIYQQAKNCGAATPGPDCKYRLEVLRLP